MKRSGKEIFEASLEKGILYTLSYLVSFHLSDTDLRSLRMSRITALFHGTSRAGLEQIILGRLEKAGLVKVYADEKMHKTVYLGGIAAIWDAAPVDRKPSFGELLGKAQRRLDGEF